MPPPFFLPKRGDRPIDDTSFTPSSLGVFLYPRIEIFLVKYTLNSKKLSYYFSNILLFKIKTIWQVSNQLLESPPVLEYLSIRSSIAWAI